MNVLKIYKIIKKDKIENRVNFQGNTIITYIK